MSEDKNKARYRSIMGLIILLTLLLGLIMGVVVGIQLSTLSSIKLGYWQGSVEATDIVGLLIRHQVRSSSEVRTTVRLENTGGDAVSCNCTLYYTATGSGDLATYSFNATIEAGETHNEIFVVDPIDVSQWAGTDLSIFEY